MGHAEAGKCLKVLLLLSDDSGFLLLIDVPYGPNRSGQLSGQFELFSRAVSLLGGRGLPGEQDKLGGVLLEPLHVGLQGLRALVPPPQVHQDPSGPGHPLVDAGHLTRQKQPKLLQAEAPAGANLHVVPDRRASHHWPERTRRGARGDAARVGLPGLASTDLASRLVEPRGHAPLPVFVEVGLHTIPAGRHGCGRKASSEGSRHLWLSSLPRVIY